MRSPWSSVPGPPCRRTPSSRAAPGSALPGHLPARRAIALPERLGDDRRPTIDVFTVNGGALGVYALTPSGRSWVRVQTTQVAIPYGSSS